MADTDSLERIRKALEGATPGEWRTGYPRLQCMLDHGSEGHGGGKCVFTAQGWWDDSHSIYPVDAASVNSGEDNCIAGTWDYETGGIRRAEDAEFIAACSPVAIRSLLAREAALREALARLMKSFPTDGDLIGAQWGHAEINEACAAYDNARAALASTEPTKEAR